MGQISQYSEQATRWMIAIDSRQQGATAQTGPGAGAVSYQNGYQELSPRQSDGAMRMGTYLPSSAEVKHAWSFTERCSVNKSEGLLLPKQAVPHLRRSAADLSSRSHVFKARSFHVRFAVDKAALGQILLQVLPSPRISIIPQRHYPFIDHS